MRLNRSYLMLTVFGSHILTMCLSVVINLGCWVLRVRCHFILKIGLSYLQVLQKHNEHWGKNPNVIAYTMNFELIKNTARLTCDPSLLWELKYASRIWIPADTEQHNQHNTTYLYNQIDLPMFKTLQIKKMKYSIKPFPHYSRQLLEDLHCHQTR